MPLLDLVTPWAAARGAPDDAHATHHLVERHAAILERIRRQRAPHLETLPLATDPSVLARATVRASDLSLQQQLRDAKQTAARLGADLPHTTVLIAGSDEGEAVLPLPGQPPLVVLFLDREPDNAALLLAQVRGQAAITRWGAADSAAILRDTPLTTWDSWELTRTVPLREWIYAVGVAIHLSQAVFPATPTHRLIGLRRGEIGRLRERERGLNALLTPDLDESGLGLVLRWLVAETPATIRTHQGTVIPPGAGRYLAWRLTADRVARVGVHEALRLPA
ncbi:MAG: hypothetical protein IPP98_06495 [Gemmatimonadetes bacterium]|nr:hypothetical protein [Gemmatimonadota bacterium]MBL0178763.1 hypothetical protein [Gemmatimonadota bacterium]